MPRPCPSLRDPVPDGTLPPEPRQLDIEPSRQRSARGPLVRTIGRSSMLERLLTTTGLSGIALALSLATAPAPARSAPADEIAKAVQNGEVIDLTVTIAENYPAHWPFHPPFKRWVMNWYQSQPGPYAGNPREAPGGPADTVKGNVFQSTFPYYSQQYVIDDHTGTQIDYPAHFVPPPGSGLEFANEHGWETGDKYPVGKTMGPAVVVDLRDILDKAEPGF